VSHTVLFKASKRRSCVRRHFGLSLLIGVLLPAVCAGQTPPLPDPLSPRVLVLYTANDAESQLTANYYATKRAIPPTNLCPLTLPDPEASWLDYADYLDHIKATVRSCLSVAGARTILYIVLAWVRPSVVLAPDGSSYALDSMIADVWDEYIPEDFNADPGATHPYYADSQNQGNVYSPFTPLAVDRNRPDALTLYSVWRLDGPTPDIARGLVDKAILASLNGISGRAWIDRRYGPIDDQSMADAAYGQGDWDLHRAAEFLAQAGYGVVEDDNPEEFGTPPAPLTCPDALFYSGWYSFGTYNDVFSWNVGAIGFHLDSYSIVWSATAIGAGITVTAGAVSEPYLEGLPRAGGLFRNLLEGANVGDAFLRNTRWLKWAIINLGDPLYRPFPGGAPGFNPPPPVNSFALSAREVAGGQTVNGTIGLAQPAPVGGAMFMLSSDAPDVVGVPDTVTVPAGSTQVTFPVSTLTVGGYTESIIYAYGPVRLANTLAVY
jgi:uncharacterized protein (TIGR03790 family)